MSCLACWLATPAHREQSQPPKPLLDTQNQSKTSTEKTIKCKTNTAADMCKFLCQVAKHGLATTVVNKVSLRLEASHGVWSRRKEPLPPTTSSTRNCGTLPTTTQRRDASDGRDGFKLFDINHSKFKQLAFDPIQPPESNDDWFLSTTLRPARSNNILIPLHQTAEDCERDIDCIHELVSRHRGRLALSQTLATTCRQVKLW